MAKRIQKKIPSQRPTVIDFENDPNGPWKKKTKTTEPTPKKLSR